LNYRRLLLAASFLAVIASQACSSSVVAFAPVGASPIAEEQAKASGSGCSITLSTKVAGFPYATVAEATATGGCDAADTVWTLATNPDGVVYRVYVDSDKLYSDQPSADGRGAYLRLVDFIHTNPVCVVGTLPSTSARIGLRGTSCPER
jgi:hypothetical protein